MMLLSRNGLIRQTVSKIGIIRQAHPKQLSVSTINNGKDESLSVLTQGFQPTAFTAEGVYIGSTYLAFPPQTLPEVDVSALTIDPKVSRGLGRRGNFDTCWATKLSHRRG
jgi:hypothetical protein